MSTPLKLVHLDKKHFSVRPEEGPSRGTELRILFAAVVKAEGTDATARGTAANVGLTRGHAGINAPHRNPGTIRGASVNNLHG